MVAKLTVVFFIVLCLLAGCVLTVFPWFGPGRVGDWGNNQLLIFVTQSLGLPALQNAVASGWVRGAVTALGVVNLVIGFWEIINFKQSVQSLEAKTVQGR